jgi:mono/diheme cytochrome c family protein
VNREADTPLLGCMTKLALIAAAGGYLWAASVPSRAAADAAEEIKQGQKLFKERCGFCHLSGGTGTIMLARRLGKDRSLLAERTDLTVEYIQKITRVGMNGMPPHNRIELPDSELDLIAIYLTRPTSARSRDITGSTGGAP